MKRRILLLTVLLAVNLLSPHPSFAATVQVEVIHSQDKYPSKGLYPLLLRLRISKPWYIHGTEKDRGDVIPTSIFFGESLGLKVEGIRFPRAETKKFDYMPDAIEVFSREILVEATLRVSGRAPLGRQTIKGNLSFQACSTNVCLPPETVPITISALIVPEGTSVRVLNQDMFSLPRGERGVVEGAPWLRLGAGLWLTLVGVFFGGLALNLTPCVYPLIPITVSYFGGRRQKGKVHTLIHGLVYILGLALTNSVLGVSAALSGGMLGSALQHPVVLIFVAGILVTLGLSFFDIWEFTLPAALTRMASKSYGGYPGTFLMGLTLGIVAAPCLGPFILGLLTYVGQRGDPLLGLLCFFVLSIGLGLPLSVLGIFSSTIHRLPVSGDWLNWVRRFLGWVLVGMAAYILKPLLPHDLGEAGLLGAVAIAAGTHLGWIYRSGRDLPRFKRFRQVFGVILICGGVVSLISARYQGEGIKWIPYDQDLLSKAVQDKRLVILDFYADWCVPCRIMESQVFRDPDIVRASQRFTTMRVDLTSSNPSQRKVLERYKVKGVPTVIFFNKEGQEEHALRVESHLDKSAFLARMKYLLERSPPHE